MTTVAQAKNRKNSTGLLQRTVRVLNALRSMELGRMNMFFHRGVCKEVQIRTELRQMMRHFVRVIDRHAQLPLEQHNSSMHNSPPPLPVETSTSVPMDQPLVSFTSSLRDKLLTMRLCTYARTRLMLQVGCILAFPIPPQLPRRTQCQGNKHL